MNDKLQHALAGFAAAMVGTTLYALSVLVMLAFGIDPPKASILPVPIISALVAGLTKEAADYLDNRAVPGLHEVDPMDVAATTAPGVALSLLLVALYAAMP